MTDKLTQDENEVNNGLVVVFRKPYSFEGKEYSEIDLSGIENMSGEQLCAAHRLFAKERGVVLTPELDPCYAAIVGGLVTGKPIEFFYGLPAKELFQIKKVISGFFFGED